MSCGQEAGAGTCPALLPLWLMPGDTWLPTPLPCAHHSNLTSAAQLPQELLLISLPFPQPLQKQNSAVVLVPVGRAAPAAASRAPPSPSLPPHCPVG